MSGSQRRRALLHVAARLISIHNMQTNAENSDGEVIQQGDNVEVSLRKMKKTSFVLCFAYKNGVKFLPESALVAECAEKERSVLNHRITFRRPEPFVGQPWRSTRDYHGFRSEEYGW